MPKPEIIPPKGASFISDNTDRAKDTFGCIDMLMERIDTYITQHPDPSQAIQNMAVAAAHIAGVLYGRMDILEIIKQPKDMIKTVVGLNFDNGFEAGGLEMFKRLVEHVQLEKPGFSPFPS